MSVGIERMPSLPATAGFSSILSFATFTLPFISVAISSSEGAIIRHGPHHSAQKSTTTGSLDFSTSESNVRSVTFAVDMTVAFGSGSLGGGRGEVGIRANRVK